MRKKKSYHQVVKRILRPEINQCVECQSKLQRSVTISDRIIVTLKQVIRLVHCGYRCPHPECPGRSKLYRSAEADALALAGFTFGLDIVLVVGHLRLCERYDIKGFPRTNNEMERTIRAIKMHYRRISGRKNWNNYLLRYGRCVAYQEWWLHQPEGEARLHARLQQVPSSSWRQVRQETRHCHQEQLNRFRFRQRPLDYLASLERRWEQPTGTAVLPP